MGVDTISDIEQGKRWSSVPEMQKEARTLLMKYVVCLNKYESDLKYYNNSDEKIARMDDDLETALGRLDVILKDFLKDVISHGEIYVQGFFAVTEYYCNNDMKKSKGGRKVKKIKERISQTYMKAGIAAVQNNPEWQQMSDIEEEYKQLKDLKDDVLLRVIQENLGVLAQEIAEKEPKIMTPPLPDLKSFPFTPYELQHNFDVDEGQMEQLRIFPSPIFDILSGIASAATPAGCDVSVTAMKELSVEEIAQIFTAVKDGQLTIATGDATETLRLHQGFQERLGENLGGYLERAALKRIEAYERGGSDALRHGTDIALIQFWYNIKKLEIKEDDFYTIDGKDGVGDIAKFETNRLIELLNLKKKIVGLEEMLFQSTGNLASSEARKEVVVTFCQTYHKIKKLGRTYESQVQLNVYTAHFLALVNQKIDPDGSVMLMSQHQDTNGREDVQRQDREKEPHFQVYVGMFGLLDVAKRIKRLPINEWVDITRSIMEGEYARLYHLYESDKYEAYQEKQKTISNVYGAKIEVYRNELANDVEEKTKIASDKDGILKKYKSAVKPISRWMKAYGESSPLKNLDLTEWNNASKLFAHLHTRSVELDRDIRKRQAQILLLEYQKQNDLGRTEQAKEKFLFLCALQFHPYDLASGGSGLFDEAQQEIEQEFGDLISANLKRDIHFFSTNVLKEIFATMKKEKGAELTQRDFMQGDSFARKFFNQLLQKDKPKAIQAVLLMTSSRMNLLPGGQGLRQWFTRSGLYQEWKSQGSSESKLKDMESYFSDNTAITLEMIEGRIRSSGNHLAAKELSTLEQLGTETRILLGSFYDKDDTAVLRGKNRNIVNQAKRLCDKCSDEGKKIQRMIEEGYFDKMGLNEELIAHIKDACLQLISLKTIKRPTALDNVTRKFVNDVLDKIVGIIGAVFAVQTFGAGAGVVGVLGSAFWGTAGYEVASGGTQLLVNQARECFGGLVEEKDRTLFEQLEAKKITVDEFLFTLTTRVGSGTAQTALFMGLGRFASVGKNYLSKGSALYTTIERIEQVNLYISRYLPKGLQGKVDDFTEEVLEEFRQEGIGIGLQNALEGTSLAWVGDVANVFFSMSKVQIDLGNAMNTPWSNIVLTDLSSETYDGKLKIKQTFVYNTTGSDANLIDNFIAQCTEQGGTIVSTDMNAGSRTLEIERNGVMYAYTMQGFETKQGALGLNAVFGDLKKAKIEQNDGTYHLGTISSIELEERVEQLRAHYVVTDDGNGTLKLFDGVSTTIEIGYEIHEQLSKIGKEYPGLSSLLKRGNVIQKSADVGISDSELIEYLPLAGIDIASEEYCNRITSIILQPGALEGTIRVEVDGKVEGDDMEYVIEFGKDKKHLSIEIAMFPSRNGYGFDFVTLSIQAARAQGFQRVLVRATREQNPSDPMNLYQGYYFFARLGFEADIDSVADKAFKKRKDALEKDGTTEKEQQDILYIQQVLNQNLAGDKLLSLMSSHLGRKVWRDHGSSYAGVLFLHESTSGNVQSGEESRSLATFESYFGQRQMVAKIKSFIGLQQHIPASSDPEAMASWQATLDMYGGKTFEELMQTPLEQRPQQAKDIQTRIMSLGDTDMDVRMQIAEVLLGKSRGDIAYGSPERTAIEAAHFNPTTHGTIRLLLESGKFTHEQIQRLTHRGVCGRYVVGTPYDKVDVTMVATLYPDLDTDVFGSEKFAYAREVLAKEQFADFYNRVKNFPLEALESKVIVDMIMSCDVHRLPGVQQNEGTSLDFSTLLSDKNWQKILDNEYAHPSRTGPAKELPPLEKRYDINYFNRTVPSDRPSVINELMFYTGGFQDHLGLCNDLPKTMLSSLTYQGVYPELPHDPKGLLLTNGSEMVYVKADYDVRSGLAYNPDTKKRDKVVILNDALMDLVVLLGYQEPFKWMSKGLTPNEAYEKRVSLAEAMQSDKLGFDGIITDVRVTDDRLFVVSIDEDIPFTYRHFPQEHLREHSSWSSKRTAETALTQMTEVATNELNAMTTTPEFGIHYLKTADKLQVDESLQLSEKQIVGYLTLGGIDLGNKELLSMLERVKISEQPHPEPHLEIYFEGPKSAQYPSNRVFSYERHVYDRKGNNPILFLEWGSLKRYFEEYPEGKINGLDIVSTSIEQAKKMGIKRVRVQGSRERSFVDDQENVGYYVFPRYGFGLEDTKDIKSFIQKLEDTYEKALPEDILQIMQKNNPKDPLLRLMSTAEGRRFRLTYGWTVDLEMTLQDTDERYRIYEAYKTERSVSEKTAEVPVQFVETIVKRINERWLSEEGQAFMNLAVSPESGVNLLEGNYGEVTEEDQEMIRTIQQLSDMERYYIAKLLLQHQFGTDLDERPIEDIAYGNSRYEIIIQAHETESTTLTSLILRRSGLSPEETRMLMRLGVCGWFGKKYPEKAYVNFEKTKAVLDEVFGSENVAIDPDRLKNSHRLFKQNNPRPRWTVEGGGYTKVLREYLSNIKQLAENNNEEGQYLWEYLQHTLKDKIIVDLFCGTNPDGSMARFFIENFAIKGYIGVDINYGTVLSEQTEREFDALQNIFEEKGATLHYLREDVLAVLEGMPSASIVPVMAGVDETIVSDHAYNTRLKELLYRVSVDGGVWMGVHAFPFQEVNREGKILRLSSKLNNDYFFEKSDRYVSCFENKNFENSLNKKLSIDAGRVMEKGKNVLSRQQREKLYFFSDMLQQQLKEQHVWKIFKEDVMEHITKESVYAEDIDTFRTTLPAALQVPEYEPALRSIYEILRTNKSEIIFSPEQEFLYERRR